MAVPTLSHTAERLYEELAPLATEDDVNGYALALYSGALSALVDEVADLSRDSEDGVEGWSQLFDLDTVPDAFLPFVAQFVGVSIPTDLTPEQARVRIRETDGFRRGTPAALKGAARQRLTGTQTVYLIERHGSAYTTTLATWESETPDPAATERDAREQKPAGIVLNVTTVTGGDFDSLRDTHTDFADVTATFADFNAVRDNPTQT